MRAMETPNPRPPWIRIAVLVVAVASLGLVMCHSERRANQPRAAAVGSPQVQPQGQAAAPDAAPAKAEKMEKPHEEYFPATKAPGKW
jgi:hypothetical protein